MPSQSCRTWHLARALRGANKSSYSGSVDRPANISKHATRVALLQGEAGLQGHPLALLPVRQNVATCRTGLDAADRDPVAAGRVTFWTTAQW